MSLDIIAKRYGALPSEIINGSVEDWNFNSFVAVAGINGERRNKTKDQG